MSAAARTGDPLRTTLTICNQKGLHARAAAKFVKCAGAYDAEISVSRDGTTVPGTSIMGLMMLAAANGCDIEVEAEGPEAEAAIAGLTELVTAKFDEE